MSDDEIDKAVKEAARYEAEDKKRKEAIDTRNDADAFVFQTEKALEEVGDGISADEKATVQADVDALKKLLEENPDGAQLTEAKVDEIKAAKEKLMNSAQQVFAKMYEQAQAAGAGAGAGQDFGGASAGPDNGGDDVVDADYKEV